MGKLLTLCFSISGLYLQYFFRLFSTGLPWTIIIVALLLAFIASSILLCRFRDRSRKYALIPWIIACLVLMLYTTVLGRVVGSTASSIHIIPFWSIQAIQEGYIETLYEKIYNVLFFIPYGFLLGLNGSKSSIGSNRFKGAVLIGFLTSVTIELLQLITRTGTCETDDVICNTVGCAVGALMGVGICRMIGKIRNK